MSDPVDGQAVHSRHRRRRRDLDARSDRERAAGASRRGGVRGERHVSRRSGIVERVDRHRRRRARACLSLDRSRTHVERRRHARARRQRGVGDFLRRVQRRAATASSSAATTPSRRSRSTNVAITADGGRTWRRPSGPLPQGYMSAVAFVPETSWAIARRRRTRRHRAIERCAARAGRWSTPSPTTASRSRRATPAGRPVREAESPSGRQRPRRRSRSSSSRPLAFPRSRLSRHHPDEDHHAPLDEPCSAPLRHSSCCRAVMERDLDARAGPACRRHKLPRRRQPASRLRRSPRGDRRRRATVSRSSAPSTSRRSWSRSPAARIEPAEHVFKNVQVLKGITAAELVHKMDKDYGDALSWNCTNCHRLAPQGNFASDTSTDKKRARFMQQMTNEINLVTAAEALSEGHAEGDLRDLSSRLQRAAAAGVPDPRARQAGRPPAAAGPRYYRRAAAGREASRRVNRLSATRTDRARASARRRSERARARRAPAGAPGRNRRARRTPRRA